MAQKPLALNIVKSSTCYLMQNVRLIKFYWITLFYVFAANGTLGQILPKESTFLPMALYLAVGLISLSCTINLNREINLAEKMSWQNIFKSFGQVYYWRSLGVYIVCLLIIAAATFIYFFVPLILLFVIRFIFPTAQLANLANIPPSFTVLIGTASIGYIAAASVSWVYSTSLVLIAMAQASCNRPHAIKSAFSMVKENGLRIYGGYTLIFLVVLGLSCIMHIILPPHITILTAKSFSSLIYDVFVIACHLLVVFIGITSQIYSAKYYKALSESH